MRLSLEEICCAECGDPLGLWYPEKKYQRLVYCEDCYAAREEELEECQSEKEDLETEEAEKERLEEEIETLESQKADLEEHIQNLEDELSERQGRARRGGADNSALTNIRNRQAKEMNHKLRALFSTCEGCGHKREAGEKFEFAHLKETGLNGRSRGRKERLSDIRLHPDHYTVLCDSCHTRYDAGLLGKEPRSLAEIVLATLEKVTAMQLLIDAALPSRWPVK